jgi:hypothetical protein
MINDVTMISIKTESGAKFAEYDSGSLVVKYELDREITLQPVGIIHKISKDNETFAFTLSSFVENFEDNSVNPFQWPTF